MSGSAGRTMKMLAIGVVRLIRPGQTAVLRTGQSWIEPARMVHELRPVGTKTAVVQLAILLRDGSPLATPVATG